MQDTSELHPSKGYGFVEFAHHGQALAALRQMNNNPAYSEQARSDGAAKGESSRLLVEFSVENHAKLKLQQVRTFRFYSVEFGSCTSVSGGVYSSAARNAVCCSILVILLNLFTILFNLVFFLRPIAARVLTVFAVGMKAVVFGISVLRQDSQSCMAVESSVCLASTCTYVPQVYLHFHFFFFCRTIKKRWGGPFCCSQLARLTALEYE